MIRQGIGTSQKVAGLALALGLAACSGGENNPPGALSEGEAQALEEAASMLDEQRPPLDAIAPPAPEQDGDDLDNKEDLTGDGAPQPEP